MKQKDRNHTYGDKKKKIEFIVDEETDIITRKVELIETKKEIMIVKESEEKKEK